MLGYCYGKKVWLENTTINRNTSTFSNPDILHTYLPMKMEQTVFRNVGIQSSDAGELPRWKQRAENNEFFIDEIIQKISISWEKIVR